MNPPSWQIPKNVSIRYYSDYCKQKNVNYKLFLMFPFYKKLWETKQLVWSRLTTNKTDMHLGIHKIKMKLERKWRPGLEQMKATTYLYRWKSEKHKCYVKGDFQFSNVKVLKALFMLQFMLQRVYKSPQNFWKLCS